MKKRSDLPFEPAEPVPDRSAGTCAGCGDATGANGETGADGAEEMHGADEFDDVDVAGTAAVDSAGRPTSVGLPDIRPIAVTPGCLYLVGTPIGNLGDLSPRAAAILAAVDRIAAEDTRRTLRLLNALGIRKPLVSYHEHNLRTRGPELVARLNAGEAIALVSDAGMPSISDPGEDLVRLCIGQSIPVTVVPGPTAAMTALAMSGLRTDRFAFEGFLPVGSRDRRLRLASLLAEPRTMIFYEAPHRLHKFLDALVAQGLGDRRISLARELTKRFEDVERRTVAEALAACEQHAPRGEYVAILEGRDAYAARTGWQTGMANATGMGDGPDSSAGSAGAPAGDRMAGTSGMAGIAGQAGPAGADGHPMPFGAPHHDISILLRELLQSGLSVKDAAREAARLTGLKRSDLYGQAQALRDRERDSKQQ